MTITLENRRRFATVQLTMLSIVVALILENLLATLLEMPTWTVLIMVQSIDILVAAFSMWVGLAFGLMVFNKRPDWSDFLTPFVLLVFLSLAVRAIATGNLVGFFLAGGVATLSSSINLWADVRASRRDGGSGPLLVLGFLVAICAIEFVGAALFWLTTPPAIVATALTAATAAIQATNAAFSIKAWRMATA